MWLKNYVDKNIGLWKRIKWYWLRFKNAFEYIKNNLINSDTNMHLTIFYCKKLMPKPCGYDKMYMDKYLVEDKLCQLIDQLS